MKKVAILGFGTVGSGVYEMLRVNKEKIESVCGSEIQVSYILDIRDFSDREDKDIFVKDFDKILNDPEVGIIAEVIGGVHPAYDYTLAALKKGKSVVTSNKELVAKKGAELLKAAKEHDVNYMFEASVGGGIPVIRPLHNCLAANEINEVCGILNGTTNYILTEMLKKGKTFSEALAEAQRLGYAERNPDADVLGIDSARKISILMALVTDYMIDGALVHTEGISEIDKNDVGYAEKIGAVIKLIGYGYKKEEKLFAAVAPSLVSLDFPISAVNGVFNGISATGNAVGEVMFYGQGAGKLPTASAVVADICDIAKDPGNKNYFWEDAPADMVLDLSEAEESYLVRIKEKDKEKAKKAFGVNEFITLFEAPDEAAFVSPVMKNKDFDGAAQNLDIIKKIRIHRGMAQ